MKGLMKKKITIVAICAMVLAGGIFFNDINKDVALISGDVTTSEILNDVENINVYNNDLYVANEVGEITFLENFNGNVIFDNTGKASYFAEDDVKKNIDDTIVEVENGKIISGDNVFFNTIGGKDKEIEFFNSTDDVSSKSPYTKFNGDFAEGNFLETVKVEGVNYSKVELSGVVGYIKTEEIQITPPSLLASKSYWTIGEDGRWSFYEAVNPLKSSEYNIYPFSESPEWASDNTRYYSDDNINFYTMEEKLKSIDTSEKYTFNYFQNLPFRSSANYSGYQYKQYLSAKGKTNSAFFNSTDAFVWAQDKYNVNSLYLLAFANLESSYGTSNFARECNNFFGRSAYDSNPGMACVENGFPTPADGIMSQPIFLNGLYADVDWYYYYGTNSGDKSSGINVLYATDVNHGLKIASIMNEIDSYLGGMEKDKYKIGIAQWGATAYNTSDYSSAVTVSGQNNYYYYQLKNPSQSQINGEGIRTIITSEAGNSYEFMMDTPRNIYAPGYYYLLKANRGSYPNYNDEYYGPPVYVPTGNASVNVPTSAWNQQTAWLEKSRVTLMNNAPFTPPGILSFEVPSVCGNLINSTVNGNGNGIKYYANSNNSFKCEITFNNFISEHYVKRFYESNVLVNEFSSDFHNDFSFNNTVEKQFVDGKISRIIKGRYSKVGIPIWEEFNDYNANGAKILVTTKNYDTNGKISIIGKSSFDESGKPLYDDINVWDGANRVRDVYNIYEKGNISTSKISYYSSSGSIYQTETYYTNQNGVKYKEEFYAITNGKKTNGTTHTFSNGRLVTKLNETFDGNEVLISTVLVDYNVDNSHVITTTHYDSNGAVYILGISAFDNVGLAISDNITVYTNGIIDRIISNKYINGLPVSELVNYFDINGIKTSSSLSEFINGVISKKVNTDFDTSGVPILVTTNHYDENGKVSILGISSFDIFGKPTGDDITVYIDGIKDRHVLNTYENGVETVSLISRYLTNGSLFQTESYYSNLDGAKYKEEFYARKNGKKTNGTTHTYSNGRLVTKLNETFDGNEILTSTVLVDYNVDNSHVITTTHYDYNGAVYILGISAFDNVGLAISDNITVYTNGIIDRTISNKYINGLPVSELVNYFDINGIKTSSSLSEFINGVISKKVNTDFDPSGVPIIVTTNHYDENGKVSILGISSFDIFGKPTGDDITVYIDGIKDRHVLNTYENGVETVSLISRYLTNGSLFQTETYYSNLNGIKYKEEFYAIKNGKKTNGTTHTYSNGRLVTKLNETFDGNEVLTSTVLVDYNVDNSHVITTTHYDSNGAVYILGISAFDNVGLAISDNITVYTNGVKERDVLNVYQNGILKKMTIIYYAPDGTVSSEVVSEY